MSPLPSWLRWSAVSAGGLLAATVAVGLAQAPASAPQSGAKSIYDANCASCHGRDGRGDGPAAGLLEPAPRDFTKGIYKFRSTATGSLPADDDLVRSISLGLPGTSMPAWKGRLSNDQIRAVTGYVRGFSPRFASERPAPVSAAAPIPSSPESIAKGRKVFADLACAACHGEVSATTVFVPATLKDDWGHDVRPADLSQPWTFRGGMTAADVFLRVKTGINGTPMPSVADVKKDPDLWDLANYVVSLGRTPTWKMDADELKRQYERERKAAAENPAERGRYLVNTLGCAHCHTPVDSEGQELPGLMFAGGQRFRLSVWGDRISANLTSDNETGIGRVSDEDLIRAITRGIKRDDSRMLPFPMGWPAFASLTDDDQKAILAFLRTIPPVSNKIPPPSPPGVASFFKSKFQMLILGRDFPIVVFSGNAGSAGNGGSR